MSSTIKKLVMALATVAAFALGGAAIAGAVQGSGDTGSGSGTTSMQQDQNAPGGQRSGETPLTGDTATKVADAALAKVGGGTVIRVETDAEGNAAYEAHIMKADGSEVTVYVDKQFNVVGVDEHAGRGPCPNMQGQEGGTQQQGGSQQGTEQGTQQQTSIAI